MRDAGSTGPRVAFYVQHLLGIGHLVRAFRIAEALAGRGWTVDLLVGGVVPPGLSAGAARLVPLPPVKAASTGLTSLVHPDGSPFDEQAQASRRDRLLAHVRETRPDVLLIEAFPFGRRQMRFELLPLLEACRNAPRPPLIATSVRDILQAARNPERPAETRALLDRFFDLVLVHGDPALARLGDTFPQAAAIAAKTAYTGLVAPPEPAPDVTTDQDRYDVVVSAGGGAVGAALLRAALQARPRSRYAHGRWLVLTGPNLPEPEQAELAAEAGPGTTVVSFVPGLVGLLRSASVSISQAGYNTVADLLVARCPAVLVPFASGGETEQTTRAALLAARGRAAVVSESELHPDRLAAAIDGADALPGMDLRFALDGAARTADLLADRLARFRAETDASGFENSTPRR
jgi:predicted glycosyltransferase